MAFVAEHFLLLTLDNEIAVLNSHFDSRCSSVAVDNLVLAIYQSLVLQSVGVLAG